MYTSTKYVKCIVLLLILDFGHADLEAAANLRNWKITLTVIRFAPLSRGH